VYEFHDSGEVIRLSGGFADEVDVIWRDMAVSTLEIIRVPGGGGGGQEGCGVRGQREEGGGLVAATGWWWVVVVGWFWLRDRDGFLHTMNFKDDAIVGYQLAILEEWTVKAQHVR